MLEETLDKLYNRLNTSQQDLETTVGELLEKEKRIQYLESEYEKLQKKLNDYKEHTCPVCFIHISKHQAFVTKCNHRLCGQCASKLLMRDMLNCPLCRRIMI